MINLRDLPDLEPYGFPPGSRIQESGSGVFWVIGPDGTQYGWTYEDTTDWMHLNQGQREMPWIVRQATVSGELRAPNPETALRVIALFSGFGKE